MRSDVQPIMLFMKEFALYNNWNLVNNKSNLFPVDQTGQVSLHKYTVHLILCILYVYMYNRWVGLELNNYF